MPNNRDDFSAPTKRKLGERVNYICSNPKCHRGTKAAGTRIDEIINTGVAAHICAAAPGGPRYDERMTQEQRCSIENGIWLCQTCSKLIDSDEQAYTVEVLKKWKEFAEVRANEGLVEQIYEKTTFEENLITGASDVLELKQLAQFDEVEYDEENYTQIYKEYISKFENLKDYLFSECIGNFFGNKYDSLGDDKYLILGKNILDWLIGKENFPVSALMNFYEKIEEDYHFEENSFLKKRWNAITAYFNGNIKTSKDIYFEVLEEVKRKTKIPYWFKDDICIDGRNINNQLDNLEGKFSINNVFQDEININKHKLSYPVIDRIKSDIYEESIERVMSYKNRLPNTRTYGIGLEKLFNSIQEAVYMSILYGSITQLRLVRNVLSNAMSLYADCYEDENFYKLTLKLKVLSVQFDEFKKICNKIKYEYKFVNSEEFLEEILSLKNSILPFDVEKFECFIFDVYGRNICDKLFYELEEKIYNMIDDEKEINPYRVVRALKVIPNNLHRMIKKEKLFQILSNYIEKGYSRFYMEFNKILNNIEMEDLEENEREQYITLVKTFSKLDNAEVIASIINIKKHTDTTEFDEYISNSSIYNKILGELEDNHIQALKDIISVIKSNVEQRENKPGVHVGKAHYYNIMNVFNKNNYKKEYKEIVKESIFPLAREILTSPNQYATEKINILKTISNIVSADKFDDLEDNVEFLLNNISLEFPEEPFSEYKTKDDLIINKLLLEYISDRLDINTLLTQYLIYSVQDEHNIEEVLKCIIQLIQIKNEIPNECIEKIYVLYKLAINKRKIKLTECAIEISDLFMDTEYENDISEDLREIMSYNNYDELITIIRIIHKKTSAQREKYKDIIEVLKEKENFNLKYVLEKFFVDEEL